jgi:hypothetical protein
MHRYEAVGQRWPLTRRTNKTSEVSSNNNTCTTPFSLLDRTSEIAIIKANERLNKSSGLTPNRFGKSERQTELNYIPFNHETGTKPFLKSSEPNR